MDAVEFQVIEDVLHYRTAIINESENYDEDGRCLRKVSIVGYTVWKPFRDPYIKRLLVILEGLKEIFSVNHERIQVLEKNYEQYFNCLPRSAENSKTERPQLSDTDVGQNP